MTEQILGITTKMNKSTRNSGFTLIEVMIAVGISAFLIATILKVYTQAIYANEELKALAEPMTTGPRLLDMIEDDIHALWTHNIKDNRVFKGENQDIFGVQADRLHLLVAGKTLFDVRLSDDSMRPMRIAEVSYLLKTNPQNAELLELWRREDPLVDDDPLKGGTYQRLADRVRSFNIRYFASIGREAEDEDDWDSAEKNALPRRIEIELVIERRPDTFNVLNGAEVDDIGGRKLKFRRQILLDPIMATIFEPGTALVASIPNAAPSLEESAQGGGAAMANRQEEGGGAGRDEKGAPQRNTTTTEGFSGLPGRGSQRPTSPRGIPSGALPFPGGGNAADILRRLGGAKGGAKGGAFGGGGGKGR